MYGWSAEEALGRDLAQLTVAPEHLHDRDEIMEVLRAHGRWEGEFNMVRRNGGTFVGVTRSAVYHDESGAPAGLVGVSLDVTERVEHEQNLVAARDHMRAITDSMGEGLITLDAGGRSIYLNAVAERMLGVASEDVVGKPVQAIVYADGHAPPPEERPLHGAPAGQEAQRNPHDVFVRRDGSRLPVAWVSSPLRASHGGTVVVFNDISEQLAKERELQLQIDELSMLDEIRRALDEDRLMLHAQPIMDLATGATTHHELLIRMAAPNGDIVPPGSFLPIAEKHGAIRDIDRWVIWQAASIAADGNRVAMNISAASFDDPHLFDALTEALAATESAGRGHAHRAHGDRLDAQ